MHCSCKHSKDHLFRWLSVCECVWFFVSFYPSKKACWNIWKTSQWDTFHVFRCPQMWPGNEYSGQQHKQLSAPLFTQVISSSFKGIQMLSKPLQRATSHSYLCFYDMWVWSSASCRVKRCFQTCLPYWHSISALLPVLLSTRILPGFARDRDDPPHCHWSGSNLSGLHWQPQRKGNSDQHCGYFRILPACTQSATTVLYIEFGCQLLCSHPYTTEVCDAWLLYLCIASIRLPKLSLPCHQVPELAAFWLLSFMFQLPVLLFFLTDEGIIILPLERAVHSLYLLFLLAQILASFLALRTMTRKLTMLFHLRQFGKVNSSHHAGMVSVYGPPYHHSVLPVSPINEMYH